VFAGGNRLLGDLGTSFRREEFFADLTAARALILKEFPRQTIFFGRHEGYGNPFTSLVLLGFCLGFNDISEIFSLDIILGPKIRC
jgi:hypothetical protein